MTPESALACLMAVLGPVAIEGASGRRPIRHEVHFWPSGLVARSTATNELTRCEPDLVVTFAFKTGAPLVFIGEMKWGWPMAQANLEIELNREIEAVQRQWPTHDQIVFGISKYAYRPLDGVILLTWPNLSARLAVLARSEAATPEAIWARLVRAFLDRADQFGFSGIPHLDCHPDWSDQPAFWNPT